MESSEIAIVLSRASELQAKLENAIRSASISDEISTGRRLLPHRPDLADLCGADHLPHAGPRYSPADVQQLEAVSHALVDLHRCLDALQDLQKQQKFDKENLLAELEENRNILIGKLGNYNGTNWEIIEEASAFVGVPVQRKDDLVLPPYQDSFGAILNLNDQIGFLKSTRESSSRRVSLASKPDEELTKDEPILSRESDQSNDEGSISPYKKPLGFRVALASLGEKAGKVVGISAKTVLLLTGIITILAFSNFERQFKKTSAQKFPKVRSAGSSLKHKATVSCNSIQKELCPPGKILLVEDGVHKCVVKERIEVPFREVVKQPDASYGCG